MHEANRVRIIPGLPVQPIGGTRKQLELSPGLGDIEEHGLAQGLAVIERLHERKIRMPPFQAPGDFQQQFLPLFRGRSRPCRERGASGPHGPVDVLLVTRLDAREYFPRSRVVLHDGLPARRVDPLSIDEVSVDRFEGVRCRHCHCCIHPISAVLFK
jgi:hypothetical protein